MSSKNFAANALHAEQDVAKHAANLFGSAKDLIRLAARWEDLEDFKVCCLSRVFIELKA
ncbi:hypothetical protein [Flavobacterium sp. ZT3R18]|uniref:hypothetical protein n=1 Tax=Flavobacterium sp. ZT3R18 TaxID=2594429 RepID=UPI00163DD645|nr:hypothetical protein [Flavobacterium sp. ZT3R18]